MLKYFTLFIITSIILISCQSGSDNVFLGKDHARKSLAEALADPRNLSIEGKPQIDGEEQAIKFAEGILFTVYGRETIEKEKPYEAYNIDGYWVINGTLPKGVKGGTFEIIFNSRDGKIIRTTHYK